jgi:hypothetical protein
MLTCKIEFATFLIHKASFWLCEKLTP